jgi:hypothetical protein
METLNMYEVTAKSWGLRLVRDHRFEMPGKSEDDVRRAVLTRWPEAFDVHVRKVN